MVGADHSLHGRHAALLRATGRALAQLAELHELVAPDLHHVGGSFSGLQLDNAQHPQQSCQRQTDGLLLRSGLQHLEQQSRVHLPDLSGQVHLLGHHSCLLHQLLGELLGTAQPPKER